MIISVLGVCEVLLGTMSKRKYLASGWGVRSLPRLKVRVSRKEAVVQVTVVGKHFSKETERNGLRDRRKERTENYHES